MSITELILQASLPVQLILLLLLFMSLFSWYWIFRKGLQIRNARLDTREFENVFWRDPDLHKLYTHLSPRKNTGALERIFMAGFAEYNNNDRHQSKDTAGNGARVAMISTYQQEMDTLEDHLGGLASIGSVSPYIGLFGTVWGIMQAFRGLSNVHQATLSQVAPGIAEALVATALGLFAAIPAVLAYNHFTQEVDRLRIRFDTFISELTVLIQREPK